MKGGDAATMLRSLALLIDAGMPLESALGAVARSADAASGARLRVVQQRVREGSSLAAALDSQVNGALPKSVVRLVRAGERGSGLTGALARAADELEWYAELRRAIVSASMYPLVMIAVGSASILLLVGFVIPRFASMLSDLGQTLPLTTRALLAGAGIVRVWGLWFAGGMLVCVVAARALLDSPMWRRRWDEILLTVPIVGDIRSGLAAARVARSFGALLAVGAPTLTALEGASESVDDAAIRHRLLAVRRKVVEGASLSLALRDEGAVTPFMLQLLQVGEKSGKVPEMLERAAEVEASNARRRIASAVALLEPTLILMFAALVAFVAAALLQAVYAVQPAGAT